MEKQSKQRGQNPQKYTRDASQIHDSGAWDNNENSVCFSSKIDTMK